MTGMPKLTDAAVSDGLNRLPGWERRGDAIVKKYAFPSYLEGIFFVNRVAPLAEQADHHPDLTVGWKKVTVSLSTHSAGGITEKDMDLARKIEGVAGT